MLEHICLKKKEEEILFWQQTCNLTPPNSPITCLPSPRHVMHRKSCVHKLSFSRSRHKNTSNTTRFPGSDMLQCFWKPLYDLRACSHGFSLPKGISFMKINGVSVSRNHGRTQPAKYQPILVAFSWGGINKHAIHLCAPLWFLEQLHRHGA